MTRRSTQIMRAAAVLFRDAGYRDVSIDEALGHTRSALAAAGPDLNDGGLELLSLAPLSLFGNTPEIRVGLDDARPAAVQGARARAVVGCALPGGAGAATPRAAERTPAGRRERPTKTLILRAILERGAEGLLYVTAVALAVIGVVTDLSPTGRGRTRPDIDAERRVLAHAMLTPAAAECETGAMTEPTERR
ncbi:hypothetical protein [Nocardia jiangsuensis]|uniref:TetR family transcriptional regulator n=1 Tax=Nocardia jiangsuensis TaxID=1691563 RepID=A0ABV8DLZ4_9NOCA